VIGGTSVASPIIASTFALAGGAHGVKYPAATLYSRLGSPAGFPAPYNVTEGGNGRCDDLYTGTCQGSMSALSPLSLLDCGKAALVCNAAPGYNGPTGVGTPNGITAFEPESAEEHTQRVAAEAKAAEKQAEEKLMAAEEAKKAAEKQQAEEAKHKLEEEQVTAAARKAEAERKAAEKQAAEEAEARSGEKGGGDAANNGGASDLGTADLTEAEVASPSHASGRGAGKASIRLTGLALTARASVVIAHSLPSRSQVAFSFTLSARSSLRVTLSRQVRVHGRMGWVSASGALALTATKGHDHARLRGQGTLPPGRYRLTLAPAHGGARSIVFVLR
jgi:hypothetical protein